MSRVLPLAGALLLAIGSAPPALTQDATADRTGAALLTALDDMPSGGLIKEVGTDAARYRPGEPVTVEVDLVNGTGTPLTGVGLTVEFSHLGGTKDVLASPLFSLAGGENGTRTLTWTPPTEDYRGYLVQVALTSASGDVLGVGRTAVDVSSTTDRFPRYGFVSDYGSGVNASAVQSYLNDHHINAVQFYDWQYKTHVPLAGTPSQPATQWTELSGRTNYAQTVRNLIQASHTIGADAYNYNTLYNAWAGYGEDGSGVNYQTGLFHNSNCTNQASFALPAGWQTNTLYLFNPGDTRWQDYLTNRERDAFAAYDFDGWQIDQLGDQGFLYSCGGQVVDVAQQFNPFIDAAKRALPAEKLVFNAVGGYGTSLVASNPNLSFLYTEAWPGSGQATYNDLADELRENRNWSGGTKNSVLAAYMDSTKCDQGGSFGVAGVLLTDATIFAHGGSHIELGDVQHMLCAPYFVNKNLSIPSALRTALRNYYDFLVAYENLLRDGQQDISHTISLPGRPTSTDGRAGTVWTFAKRSGSTDVLHLINLRGNTSTDWRDPNGTYSTPPTQTNVTVKYYYGTGTPTAVNVASPDINGGASKQLSFTTGSDGGGSYVQFTVPELRYWDTIWLTR